jgi:hypothetical protein
MKIVKVESFLKNGLHISPDQSISLLVGVDDSYRIAKGDWAGHRNAGHITHCFVLKAIDVEEHEEIRSVTHMLFYGGTEHSFEPTNIGRKVLAKGMHFTVFNQSGSAEEWTQTFEISNLHEYIS